MFGIKYMYMCVVRNNIQLTSKIQWPPVARGLEPKPKVSYFACFDAKQNTLILKDKLCYDFSAISLFASNLAHLTSSTTKIQEQNISEIP